MSRSEERLKKKLVSFPKKERKRIEEHIDLIKRQVQQERSALKTHSQKHSN